jgi:hypothetical protein
VIADLDTLLIALYVELTDPIIASLGSTRSGPGKPPEVTDAELACLAVAQVLLRYDDERHWLRAAPKQVGHLLPRRETVWLGTYGCVGARPDPGRSFSGLTALRGYSSWTSLALRRSYGHRRTGTEARSECHG